MSRNASRRLLARSPLTALPELIPTSRISSRSQPFTSTSSKQAEGADSSRKPPSVAAPRSFPGLSFAARKASSPASTSRASPSLNPQAQRPATSNIELAALFSKITLQNHGDRESANRARYARAGGGGNTSFASNRSGNLINREGEHRETSWQMHIYATRHNVHITIVRPPAWYHPQTGKRYPEKGNNRTVAMSLAAGNLGFRKAGRKHYDSAFQLASYVMGRMKESGINSWIQELEVFLRGFGAGREAVTKALLGTEGRYLRSKVVRVSDATRLKFGGTRSKKPRRLG